MNAFRAFFEHYVTDASFMWVLRSIAVNQPHYTQSDISELDVRINAQLDGLMENSEIAWELCLDALELEQPGEVFVSALVAFKSHDANKIQKALDAGLNTDETFKGLVSALAWLPKEIIHPWVKKFLTSKDLNHKYLALAVCSARRENPGEYLKKILSRDDCKAHNKLYARALRLVGELKRQALIPELNEAIESDNEDIKFWANWSSLLLGNKEVIHNLKAFVFNENPHQIKAINVIFRTLPVVEARQWISKLSADDTQMRTLIKATGILGDPHAIQWLLLKMKEPACARLAGEAFTLITGFDLTQHGLTCDAPIDIESHPNEDISDDDVSLDEDEHLAWPNQEKVSHYWAQKGHHFNVGQRYFLGKKINPNVLKSTLKQGFQRQRKAATIELALIDSAAPLHNIQIKGVNR